MMLCCVVAFMSYCIIILFFGVFLASFKEVQRILPSNVSLKRTTVAFLFNKLSRILNKWCPGFSTKVIEN